MKGEPITSTPGQALTGSVDENEGACHNANAAKVPAGFRSGSNGCFRVTVFGLAARTRGVHEERTDQA
ncbi:hypothetical protein NA8A_07469 [Nitratireductor indicus C115]|uniref:Uncharacterized protein n=1 Tax=Nitratireductor indicus C115 TaxID=1231190 RepID=K2PQ32_9HYPH|nr:hypothetical protein NA8A_07469 [Nitratireductor indicus C115]